MVVIEIPGYSMLGQIGRGGMATVYRARQILLDREVALKVMSPQLAQDAVYAQRFLQEARMLASLNHPHIVQVYDIGVTPDGLNYFSMQLLTGGDFISRLSDGLSEQELVRVLVAVAQALGFSHARGYVHRDVTPANIMFDAHDVPVLTDFGIARALASTSRITSSGLSIGTSHYMSPEQARGVEVDRRSDIYSLGVVCFEALSGHPPFEGEDGFAVAFAHVHDPVPRLPIEVERWQPLIDRAMAKDPAERFPDCAAFIEGLREIAPDEVRASSASIAPLPATAKPEPAKVESARMRALPWKPIALAAAAVASGAVLAFGLWSALRSPASLPATAAPPAVTLAAPAPRVPVAADVAAPSADSAEALPLEIPLVPGEVLPEHTVIDPVATLIGMGKANILAKRLSTPPVTNAVDRFKLALLIEPGNAEAQAGIAEVAAAYLAMAAQQDPDTDPDAWLQALAQAEQIAALSPTASRQAAEAKVLRNDRASAWRQQAQRALRDWQGVEADRLFRLLLKVSPGDAEATRGLALAASVGKPGYRFSETLSGGGSGPEMQVLPAGFALARYEVTVAEFGAYWNAAGSKKFAGRMPACKDREALLFSSKSRTWQAPDIAQGGSHPVVCVDVAMAEGYAAWLSEQTGESYRLPAQAELKGLAVAVADCKSNIRDQSYRAKFGGRDATCDDGHAATAPVGSFTAREGIFDADGNVREWTRDCPAGNCKRRVVVGRGWMSPADDPVQDDFPADIGFNTVGFRVLRVID